MKKIFNLIIIILVLLIFAFIKDDYKAENKPSGFLVKFFDVGQGDATYFRAEDGFEILIDGGPDKKILNHLENTMEKNDKQIDVVVLTHPHSDHLNGLVSVLENYKVDLIFMTDSPHTSEMYFKWLDVIKQKNIKIISPKSGDTFSWGTKLSFKILYPDKSFIDEKNSNLNLTSLVGIVSHGQDKFLMTGDAEIPVLKTLLGKKIDLSAIVFKVPHHGSSNGLYEPFLDIVNPQFAIIFSGKNNQFGHPEKKYLEALESRQIVYFDTQIDGDIMFTKPTGSLKVETSR